MAVDDPRARDMLRAYRSQHSLAGERGGAIWTRLERSIDEGVDVAEERALAPRRRVGWIAVVAIAAGVVLALAIAPRIAERVIAPTVLPLAEHEAPQPIEQETTLPAAVPPKPASAPTFAPVAAVPDEPPTKGVRARPRRAAPLPETDDLVVEFGLIRRARRALQSGDPTTALALLDAHAHAFPRGQMLEDRLALRVEALCATGAEPQARAEARALQRRFPGSTHEARPCAPR